MFSTYFGFSARLGVFASFWVVGCVEWRYCVANCGFLFLWVGIMPEVLFYLFVCFLDAAFGNTVVLTCLFCFV